MKTVQELEAIRDKILEIKRKSLDWLITKDFSQNIENLLAILDTKILELKYTSEITKEDWDIMTAKMNKILTFAGDDFEGIFEEFDFNSISNKVNELNKQNEFNAEKIQIFGNGETKAIGKFRRIV